MSDMWMVRSGTDSEMLDEFLESNVAAIGFASFLGDFPLDINKSDLVSRLRAQAPDWKEGKIQNAASQFVRFVAEVKKGDLAVTYDASVRRYIVGTVQSGVRRDGDARYPFRRDVRWEKKCARDVLSPATRNSLGSTLTLFKLPDEVRDDILSHTVSLESPDPVLATPAVSSSSAESEALQDVPAQAKQLIEDRLARLDWEQMQELVAGVLRAMGFKTQVAGRGPDGGRDVFASPDGLGLLEPRVFVEVKHRSTTSIGAPDIRSFLGGRRPGDRCLYVSTGGFTKEARMEAARSTIPVTLVDLPALRQLVLDHYDRFDDLTRALVPMQKIYWPVPEDE